VLGQANPHMRVELLSQPQSHSQSKILSDISSTADAEVSIVSIIGLLGK